MFLQKFDISINKQARPITNFNSEVTKLPSGDGITRFDGSQWYLKIAPKRGPKNQSLWSTALKSHTHR
jgi:hypothetical protein